MPAHSPKSRNRELKSGGGGRLEFLVLSKPPAALQRAASEPPSPRHRAVQQVEGPGSGLGLRRDSASSSSQPDDDCMKLNPSLLGIALRSLLAIDLWLSKRLGVCATEDSPWGSARPIMKLIEVSGHGIPWIGGTLYCLCKSDSTAGQEVLLNLLLASNLPVNILEIAIDQKRDWNIHIDAMATRPGQRLSILHFDLGSGPSRHCQVTGPQAPAYT
ncbi:polyisoprenoid diphosphate/phosphate phosphohydrolase PLPP6 isoform X2 [Scyliorhinus torazame]|uniref:polyisoprenoid diphosphate/phosphate phosphohydrolase PLPP6 isoform X2 n=1 Tax=Scyliorhinus torazame TaxID=75743 RepID=UPI003B59378D